MPPATFLNFFRLRYVLRGVVIPTYALASAVLIVSGTFPQHAYAAATSDARISLNMGSLSAVSVDGLRRRHYDAKMEIEGPMGVDRGNPTFPSTFFASFRSEGLREYARIDIPTTAMPDAGYPVVVFLHGWVGEQAAPQMDFTFSHSGYAALIRGFVDAGFLVVTPGFRGHGTWQGRAADGLEFLRAWDNGTYVSPVFYAIDTLNLLESLPTLEHQTHPQWTERVGKQLRVDRSHVGVIGHSQGGDVALMVLAVCGHGTPLRTPATAGSIWSGTFPGRLTQRGVYHAMETTAEAFLAGDGTWTGTAIGHDGRVNPDFVFGYPPDWLGVEPPSAASVSTRGARLPTVREAVEAKTREMYATFNALVGDLHGVSYRMRQSAHGHTDVVDDPRVISALTRVGGFETPELLTLPMALHHSDRDFYAFSSWNSDLCDRVNRLGGHCEDHEYPGNTHLLGVSAAAWFSPPGTQAGFMTALARDVALFGGNARHD
jgi:dienelactone hydrolase